MSTPSKSPVPNLAFALGCLTFIPRSGPSGPKTWGQHFRNVEAALRDAGASRIRLSLDDEIEHEEIAYSTASDRPLSDGGGIGPPGWATVVFTIRVPASFQRAKIPWREPEVENYTVYAHHPYHLPATFVVSERPDDPDPSVGVQLVREFLLDRLQDVDSLRFDFLGPSPFHADAYLVPREAADAKDQGVGCRRVRQRGYDALYFDFDPLAQTPERAFERMMDIADSQLSFFYLVEWIQGERYRAWEKIDELVTRLVEMHERKGLRPYFRKTFRSAPLTSSAFIALASYESEVIMSNKSLEEDFARVFGHPDDFFRDQTRDDIDHMFEFPVAQTADLVSRFEARRTGATANLLLILGPLVGVVIGAALTLLIGGESGPPA